jgi:hypothetical protein
MAVFMTSKILRDPMADFESREITDSRKFQSKRGACVDTVFWKKQVKQGSREAVDEKQSVICRLKEEQSSQRDLPMVRRVQP